MSASIIPLKISQLALLVSQRKHIPLNVALGYIYDTPFYAKLYDEDAKWWYLDTESLYRLMEQSWLPNGRIMSNNVVVFLTFCMENYVKKHNMTSLEAYALFRRYHVDVYLVNGFDMLHTQGGDAILQDIEIFIKNRKNQER